LKDLPGVGENLRDHPAIAMLYEVDPIENEKNIVPMQAGMRYTTPGSKHRNDMQISPLLRHSEHMPPHVQLDPDKTYLAVNVALQKAEGKGRLTLASSDPHAQPVLEYRYLGTPWDLERMRGAVRQALEIMSQPQYDGLLRVRVSPPDNSLDSDDALDKWLMDNVGTQQHSTGTCKMGPSSDPMAVVDQYCRVHGLEGLRVVDASIMPDVVRANTNATAIMIGERVADMIANGER
jgi:choline dehydrogenase-like flavoprotein